MGGKAGAGSDNDSDYINCSSSGSGGDEGDSAGDSDSGLSEPDTIDVSEPEEREPVEEDAAALDLDDDIAYDARLRGVSKAIQRITLSGCPFMSGSLSTFPLAAFSIGGQDEIVPPLTETTMKTFVEQCEEQATEPQHHDQKPIDTHARHAWSLASTHFQIVNPAWDRFLTEEIVASCRRPLGIHENVTVETKLTTMRVQEPGGTLEPNRDRGQDDDNSIVGRLVVVLPGRFTGGEVVVHTQASASAAHRSSSSSAHVWYPATMSPFAIKYAAFHSECKFDVMPVTTGYQLCMIYDLCAGSKPVFETLKHALCRFFRDPKALQQHKRQRLSRGSAARRSRVNLTDPSTHRACKLVYVLSHKYTHTDTLSFQNLHAHDALVATNLEQFCEDHRGVFALYLCKIKYESSWRGRYVDGYNRNDDQHETTDQVQQVPTQQLKLLLPWIPFCRNASTTPAAIPVAARGKWESVTAELMSEVAPTGMFSRPNVLPLDGNRQEIDTHSGVVSVEKWYFSAALVVVPIRVDVELQFVADPMAWFKRWVALVDTNPAHARALAMALPDQPCCWSITSADGVTILDAVRKLGDLEVLGRVLLSCEWIEFQPKLRELVAPFTTVAVVKMVKQIHDVWSKPRKRPDNTKENRVGLLSSMLNGVANPAIIKPIMDALPIVAYDLFDFGDSEVDDQARGYARVLLLASLVSADYATLLLQSHATKFFVFVAAPAVHILITAGRGAGLHSKSLRAITESTIDQLKLTVAHVWKRVAEAQEIKCDACPQCECHAVKDFLISNEEFATLTSSQSAHAHWLTVEYNYHFVVDPSPSVPLGMVVKRPYGDKIMAKAQEVADALRLQLASTATAV